MAGRKSDFTLTKLDDLFSTQEQRDEEKLSKIRDIPLTEIDDFPDHPFKVRDDEDMAQLIESIKERGVITPATVRQKEDGRYELISGHRRKRACELAGFDTLRCEVVELNRDEATILMVESNYQRSQILPSEKAFAYKMRSEAMKRQAGRPSKDNSSPVGIDLRGKQSLDLMSEECGDSRNQIHRYIRLANAVEDNIADYISDFMSLGAGSDIEYLSADEANTLYLELVRNSVSYMVMARLGLDADKVYSPDDFAGISSFNSQEVLNAVGIATSDIAEMALLPVSRTISTLSKENRIIDEQGQSEYNKDIKDERSQSDERNHIHDGGRLQSSEPEAAGADGSDSRQMVADEENLSEGTSQNPVLQSSDERDSEQSLGGGSAESQRTGGNSREADGTESRADGADESGRYDEVGSSDEQHQELGTGNREESGNIRLEYYDRNHEDKSLPFFGGDDTIREILGTTPHLSASKEEIKDFYERNTDNATRTEYIKGIFNNDYTQLPLSNGRLYDFDMPLFNKELSREEFDRKVRENPMNDHLKVSVLPAEEKAVTGENEAQNDTETVQDFSPKTGYDDAFFINRENESITWMYYNPDSNAGGQYVTNTLSFDEIQQAAREYDSAEDFFDYLGSIANQELADVGTEWFVDANREFHRTPDLTDCTSATMKALIKNAERTDMVATNIGNVPIEDYREIVATQNGFDSYEEMYNEGVRIGNGYDKEPEPIVPAWEQKKKSKVKSFDLHPDIPMSERHNFDLANNQVEEVNKKERFHRNYAAIKVLKDCQNENRFATPDEQKILSRYVGWGGIPEAFDERAGAWHTEYAMLKNILTPEEYASARESTLTAFYTPPEVSTAIYKVLEQMGFQEGNLLEPSCGIGNFIGMLPKSMENAKVYGVELDTISAGIAQQLYQKSSIAAQGFEEVNVPDSFFDGVIGNVPFGDFKVSDKRYDKDVRIFDYIEDDEGKKKAVLNKKETAIAQAKQELIKQGFQDWIWADPTRREKLTKMYNEKFNSIRPREYDGSHIVFNGMNPEIELREHQKNAVAHILYGGNTLLAHAVGAGKTFEMVAAAMESKRLGLCNKSLFVVPNHLTEQWAAEFLQLYPAANILVATKRDFETKNRKKFCGRIATGDYDAVIIGHSQFEKIPMSIERQRAILEQQLEELTDGIMDLKRNRGENFSIKQLEKSKKSVKQKLEKLNDQSRKDDVVTFEELGVDRLFIDESHYYKNLYLYTKMRNVGGIAQTEAQKSSDLFMKCRYLDELTGGRGTVFATGTPISNSMVELYTIQRYLQYNTLVKNNLQHFDSWASTFGETVTAVELTPEGTGYRAKTRFAKFYNLPELMAMFKEVADIKTADMLELPVPDAHFHNVAVKPSEMQKEMVASLAERAEKVRGGGVDSSIDNMLKITNDGRKLALDQRMLNDMLPDFEGSKINACVDNIYRIWEETADKKSAQLVFCDLSTPKNDGTFSVYNDIRKKLIERGVPESEVRFIHEADTDVKKKELFQKTRKGEVRVLLGSTQKMGAGTNVQDRLSSLFFSFLFIKLTRFADLSPGGRCPVPVNLILDEFNNIGRIGGAPDGSDFCRSLSVIRSRDIRVMLAVQSLGQLQNRYPNNLWSEIIGNCDIQLMLGCTDDVTADYISDRSGEMCIVVDSTMTVKKTVAVTQVIPQYRETQGQGKRKLLTPDEVLRLPHEQMLVIIRGQNLLLLNKFDYTRHPMSKEMVRASIMDYCPRTSYAPTPQTGSENEPDKKPQRESRGRKLSRSDTPPVEF